MKKRLHIFLFGMAFVALCLLFTRQRAFAQGGGVDWSLPEEMSGSKVYSNYPAIVADSYGQVHLFWAEDVGGIAAEGSTNRIANTIIYRRWVDGRWNEPVDLFIDRRGLRNLVALVDRGDQVHLFWQEEDGLHTSMAPVFNAMNALAWSRDQVLVGSTGSIPAVLVGDQGEIHLLFAQWNVLHGGGKDGNIYYRRLNPGSDEWTQPLLVSDIDFGSETLADTPGLALDANGRLHAVWYTIDPPDWLGSAVYYARSDDGGRTWQPQDEIDRVSGDTVWASKPKIAVLPPQEVHLTWVCGQLAYRCQKWSQDGGQSWSAVERQVFGDLHSLAYWDAMAVDASGTLYWILQLRYPEGLYLTRWDGDHWMNPPLVLSSDSRVRQGHGPEVTVNNGNEIHLVVVTPPNLDSIYHLWAHTPATSIRPLPTPADQRSSEVDLQITPSSLPTADVVEPDWSSNPPVPAGNPVARGLWAGVLPVAVLVLIVSIVVFWRRVH